MQYIIASSLSQLNSPYIGNGDGDDVWTGDGDNVWTGDGDDVWTGDVDDGVVLLHTSTDSVQ